MNVIAVDRNMRSPGFELADIQVQCSILRPRRIVRTLQENVLRGMIAGVGCRSFGKANVSAAVLTRELGLPGVDLESALRFNNKRAMKQLLSRSGVTVPRVYAFGTDADRRRLASAPLPLIVRPVRGHAKRGITILREETDVQRFLWAHPTDDHLTLVEEFIEGQEVTVLGLVTHGKFASVLITDKIVSKEPPLFAELKHRYPSQWAAGFEEKIHEAMQVIVETTGISAGPIVAEFLLAGRKKTPYLVEVSPDPGGEYLADHLFPIVTGRDFFEEMVRNSSLFLRDYETDEITSNGAPHAVIRFIPQRDGKLRELRLPQELFVHPGFLFANILRYPGEVTSTAAGNSDRLAVFGLSADATRADELEHEVEDFARKTIVEYEAVR